MLRVALGVAVPFLSECAGRQSVVAPAGQPAGNIAGLWWIALSISVVVWVLVMAALLYGAFRKRVAPTHQAPIQVGAERGATLIVSIAVALTVVVLLVWLALSVSGDRALASMPPAASVDIQVTGHQWWWEVRYLAPQPSEQFTTANEIHVPVGRPVMLQLTSADVIHSFWVPNVDGKRDLIPGHVTTTWFQADTPGVYRGQCAEFCGYQHANMALYVVAESPARYATWLAAQREPAAPPRDSLAKRGEVVFLSSPCPYCHAIEGTMALGRTAPDLTHFGSRMSIAAGELPNTRGNLAGWILDPQQVKPGNKMPATTMGSSDLQALLAYLESLR